MKLRQPVTPQGPAELEFIADENRSTSLRFWEVVISDQRAVVSQEAATCTWSLTPSRLSVDASGGKEHAALKTEEFCTWELLSPAPWIDLAPERGQGSTEITIRVSRNTGGTRTENVRVAGAVIEIRQREAPPAPSTPPPKAPPTPPSNPPPVPAPPAPPPSPPVCTFTVTPDSFAAAATGGSIAVTVNTSAGCAWTAAGAPSWITVSPSTGSGAADISLTAVANSGTARNAVLAIAGREFRITQAQAPCTYTVTPDRFEVSRKKHEKEIRVSTLSHCQWTATSSASWARVPSSTRTGSGEIDVTIEENTRSDERTAIVTIAGHNFIKEVRISQEEDDDD